MERDHDIRDISEKHSDVISSFTAAWLNAGIRLVRRCVLMFV